MEPVYFILPVQIMLLKHIRNTDFGGELFSQSGEFLDVIHLMMVDMIRFHKGEMNELHK